MPSFLSPPIDRLEDDSNLRHIIEASLDGFWIIDNQGHFCEVNNAYCQMIGYQRQELLKMSILDVEYLENPEEITRHIERIMSLGADRFQTKHRRKDGLILDIDVSVSLGHDDRLYCFIRDETERKQSEQALLDSEFRWKFAIEGTGDGVWDWNIETDKVKYSRRWKEMLGYSKEDILPENQEWVDRIHPEDQAYVAKTMTDYIAGKTEIYLVEYRLRCKNDAYKWILGRGMVVKRSEDGKPLRMIGTHVDLTERKAAEEELFLQKEYLKAIFDNEPECVKVVSTDGQLLDMNAAGLKMLEVDSVEEARQFGLLNFFATEYRDVYADFHQQVIAGHSGVLEFLIKGRKGGTRWLETHATPLRDKQGCVVSFLGVARDVTEHKHFRQALEQQAHFDYLTGIYNRGFFMHIAELELTRAARYGNNLSVFMMDIDYFKQINDTYGHKVGDLVLKKLAAICKKILREVDIFGRFGDEEFAILLPDTTVNESKEVAERLRAEIEVAKIQIENGLPINFSVSIGVTSIFDKNENIDVLLDRADKALYIAKNAGRNQVHTLTSSRLKG